MVNVLSFVRLNLFQNKSTFFLIMGLNEDTIWKESFFKDNFSVDSSLSKYTLKSDLEKLRTDLKNYGTELQLQMTDILKNETEAIVNLAEYLTNLNSKIEHLSLPFFQLREEIVTLHKLINIAESTNKVMLDNIKENNNTKNHLHLKLGVISCSVYINEMLKSSADSFEDLIILERIVGKYSFQTNYMDELNIVSTDMKDITCNVEQKLVNIINRKFLEAVKNNDTEIVARCLRMYENLKKQTDAEETYRVNVVRPYLKKVLTENSLERSNQNLDKIYAEVLHFMDTKMDILLSVLDKNVDLKHYNFIFNSFWKEFDKQSREGLPLITAPGNPELFQKRFRSTWDVLLRISKKCNNENLLRDNDSFQDHIKRFNLPVYFEIRYQQIAGDFESATYIENKDYSASSNEINCHLKPTLALWKAETQCFHKDVYLDQLAVQFVKLSMLLLSRYIRWFEVTLKDVFSDNSTKEKFIIDSLIDFNIVQKFLCPVITNPGDLSKTIYKIINVKLTSLTLNIMKSNKITIDAFQNILSNHLIKMKVDEICNQLHNVGAIPRLYRRTNRTTPKEPSSYMIEAVKPLIAFHKLFHNAIEDKSIEILNSVILQVTKQYLTLVQGVLRSVCKTEESLRRLKSRNTSSEDAPQSDSGSDEMKIREQIKLDVAYFLEQLYPLGSTESREIMNSLKKEIY